MQKILLLCGLAVAFALFYKAMVCFLKDDEVMR